MPHPQFGQMRSATALENYLLAHGHPSGTTQPNIASPTGGTTVDAEARAAIDDIIAVLIEYGMIEPA